MRHPISMVTSIILVGNTLAADIRVNEFTRKGGGLVCVTDTFKPDESPPYLQCLRIGPIRIGQSEKEVELLLGNPWKVIEKDASTTIKVFPMESVEPSKPYWVITFTTHMVDSVQITGKNPKTVNTFSSIRLGDYKARVLEILGEPFATKPVEAVRGVLWSYRPFPISIEIVDDRVYSIRVSRTYQ